MKFDFDTRPSDSSLVEAVWRVETDGHNDSFISTAESRWEMVITKQMGRFTLSIRGPETKATPTPVPEGHAEYLGIIFNRGVFMPHFPKQKLVNDAIHLPQSTRNAFTVIGGVFEIPTFENVDSFILRMMRNELLTHDQVVDDVLRGGTQDLSVRSLQRRFLHVTGLTYKTIQQIERARQAMTMLQDGRSIVDVVYEAGYFDQPHLTRAMKLFMGQTPSEIAKSG